MIGELKTVLLEHAAEWNLPRGGEWRSLFFNNYQPHYSTLTLLWFHSDGAFPGVVTKLFRDPAIPRQEFDNLRQVHALAPRVAPRPLRFEPEGKFWALWMEGLPGLPMSSDAAYRHESLHALVDSIISIHAAARRPADTADSARHDRMVTRPLEALAGLNGSAAIRQGCARLAAACTPEWLGRLPVIPQHGDLFDGNALVSQDRCGVIDWESYGSVDLPFYDLFTLLFSIVRERGSALPRWNSPAAREFPALTRRYADRLGIAPETAVLLLPLSLANWFHLHWLDGRKEFAARMWRTMEDYFQNPGSWQRAFSFRDRAPGDSAKG